MPPSLQRFNLFGQGPLIALLVLCLVTALLTGRFLSPLNLTTVSYTHLDVYKRQVAASATDDAP